jgi:hypothetical protein
MQEPSDETDGQTLDRFRVPNTGLCWWCGNLADSTEHKFKRSDLKGVAGPTGEARNVYKSRGFYQKTLNSLDTGPQVRWDKNLCRRCNSQTSQPFDRAYDTFMEYLLENFQTLHRRHGIYWTDVYGEEWQQGVRHLSCYLVKQFGCMMATARLPVPQDAVDFLNGAHHVGSILVLPFRDWRAIDLHRLMLKDGPTDEGLKTFIGLPATPIYETDGRLSGADYVLGLGYLMFKVQWRERSEFLSMHDVPGIRMRMLNGDRKSRREWRRLLVPTR